MAKSYYERNKERIKKHNKMRYDTDPQYRQSVIDAVLKSRKKKSEIKKRLKEHKKIKAKHWAELEVNGKVQECCDVRYLSAVLNRSVLTIRRWERQGKIPPTFRHKSRRFYTKKHFLMMQKFWEDYGEKNLELFFKNVTENWNKCFR
jgi:adenosyl cobinamide kinase/adenosyl cobinamide phosphate guanylyltransferase